MPAWRTSSSCASNIPMPKPSSAPRSTSAPDDPTLNAQLATVLVAENKAEAVPLLQKLHAAHPADPAITRMLAEVLSVAGDYAGSDQLYLHLLAANPQDANLLVAHGQNLVRQAQLARSCSPSSTRPPRSTPPTATAWSGLAFAAFRTSHPDVTLHALTMRSSTCRRTPATLFLWAHFLRFPASKATGRRLLSPFSRGRGWQISRSGMAGPPTPPDPRKNRAQPATNRPPRLQFQSAHQFPFGYFELSTVSKSRILAVARRCELCVL